MPANTDTEEIEYTPADLPDLRAKLSVLLMLQHSDARSLRDIKRDMQARGREINTLSDTIEALELDVLDVRDPREAR